MHQLSIRRWAAVASFAAAALYLLIGLEVVTISTDVSATSDIFGFGALMAAVYGGLGMLLVATSARAALIGVAIVQLITIVGYVAVASVRTPQYEPVGLLIKALQVAILAAVAWLVLAPKREIATARG